MPSMNRSYLIARKSASQRYNAFSVNDSYVTLLAHISASYAADRSLVAEVLSNRIAAANFWPRPPSHAESHYPCCEYVNQSPDQSNTL